MTISITFSLVIYQLNYREVSNRLENLQHSLIDDLGFVISTGDLYNLGPNTPYSQESRKAGLQMAVSLVYINVVVLIAGGLGSYFLARRTLRPIEESHEAQSRFTSDASHELRTPLSAMKTELEVTLRDKDLTLSEAKEVLGSNLEEVEKLIQLSEMLLKLSRLDHDKLEKTATDIPQVFTKVLKNYPADKKRFVTSGRKKAVTQANEAAVSELITILVDNALKYSPTGTPIYVRVFEKLGSVGFEIKNAGDPIPEALLPKLFNRFFRVDTSRTDGAKNGYGLGLSIAKRIVEVHHGQLTVSSIPQETTFTFFLPIVRGAQAKLQRNTARVSESSQN